MSKLAVSKQISHEIPPCAFCKSSRVRHYTCNDERGEYVAVRCDRCGAQGPEIRGPIGRPRRYRRDEGGGRTGLGRPCVRAHYFRAYPLPHLQMHQRKARRIDGVRRDGCRLYGRPLRVLRCRVPPRGRAPSPPRGASEGDERTQRPRAEWERALMGRAARTRARQEKRDTFQDVIQVIRNARAAACRREPGLATALIVEASFDVGMARQRYGALAVVEGLRRAILHTERLIATAFAIEPIETGTKIALALFQANLGERKGPRRAPIRLLPAKAEVAS
jgi:hypothetical protein